MRHLVIGASGMVGGHLVEALRERGETALPTYYEHPIEDGYQCDLGNAPKLAALIDGLRPHFIYLAAAETNVDRCEVHPSITRRLNVTGVQHLVWALEELDLPIPVLFFSSDYIFPSGGPWDIYADAAPLQEYGRQKLAAEHYLLTHLPKALIVRTSWVWDAKKGFVADLMKAKKMRIATDQYGTPTYAPDLAKHAIHHFLDLGTDRVVHLAGMYVSRLLWAEAAKAILELPVEFELVLHDDLPYKAPRPREGGSFCEDYDFPDYMSALRRMREELR